MRDLDLIGDGFPVRLGSNGPSRGYVTCLWIGTLVGILGMRDVQGDLLHADRYGALVILNEVIRELEHAFKEVFDRGAIVMGPARTPGFDIEKL